MIKSFDIYNHPNLYDDQYWWKKNDIEFYKSILPSGSTVLELGSGTGRLAFPLLRNNIKYYGLELSSEFCRYTNNRLAEIYRSNPIIQGNMTNFKLDIKFDYIFIAFNSFLHVLNNKDASLCFKCIKNHLAKNGKFILDILVPNPLFLYRPKNHEVPVMDFKDSITGELVEIYESNSYNRETEICDIHWTYKYKDKTQDRVFNYLMRMYYPDTINRLLVDAGFTIQKLYGDYDMSKFTEESHLQIYIAT